MNIEVELLHATPLSVAVGAIRQCYESGENSDSITSNYPDNPVWDLGEKDKALVQRIIQSGHTSTLEHVSFNFIIKGISRLNLQELARHRMASLSVKSTRYTLKELKEADSFIDFGVPTPTYYWSDAEKYINLIGVDVIDRASILALENLRELVASGDHANDNTKYALPECYRLDLYWTINARSLRNFLSLRHNMKAHFEIRELAQKIWAQIPTQYRFMFEDCVMKGK